MKRKTRQHLKNKAKIWQTIIDKNVFINYYYRGDLNDICGRIEKFRGVIKKLRDYRMLEDVEYGYDPDVRTGDETYGYISLEDIITNLKYISDRCHVGFRLTWLMGVPERVSILQG